MRGGDCHLGKEQAEWLSTTLISSSALWKVVVCSSSFGRPEEVEVEKDEVLSDEVVRPPSPSALNGPKQVQLVGPDPQVSSGREQMHSLAFVLSSLPGGEVVQEVVQQGEGFEVEAGIVLVTYGEKNTTSTSLYRKKEVEGEGAVTGIKAFLAEISIGGSGTVNEEVLVRDGWEETLLFQQRGSANEEVRVVLASDGALLCSLSHYFSCRLLAAR